MLTFQLFSLIFVFLASVDASAKLLVSKEFLSTFPVARYENVFEYQIVNTGDTAAVNVELSDRESFPTDRYEIRKGTAQAKFVVIPPKSTVYHHVIVVPRHPQEFEDKAVTIQYSDPKTGKTTTGSASSGLKKYRYFYDERSLRNVIGVSVVHFVVFAAITFPLTGLCALFYWISVSRYSQKKRD